MKTLPAFALLFFGLALLLGGMIGASATSSPDLDPWVKLEHESGSQWIVRRSSVVGYSIPPKGSSLKASIMLHGGASISTSQKFTLDEFRELMEK